MRETSGERFYHLLPAIYRLRDQRQGQPLRALLAGLEQEFRLIEADIDGLYDNWFIETCEEWVIPYIADLIGVSHVSTGGTIFSGQRRRVADTLGYRRRRGNAAILERVLQDVSAWSVHVLEYGPLLATTQHLGDIRSDRSRLVDLRQAEALAMLNGPLETTAHLVDIRNIDTGAVNEPSAHSISRGKYQEENIGLFIWRLRSYPMTHVPARVVSRDVTTGRFLPQGCFTFDPLGYTMPLFTRPQAASSLTEQTNLLNLPAPIGRKAFADDLANYRAQAGTVNQALPEEQLAIEGLWEQSAYYGPERSLCVMLDGRPQSPSAIVSADLSQWNVSLRERIQGNGADLLVAIDVELGRLLFLGKYQPAAKNIVEVNFSYGFSGNFGGGPYIRHLFPDSTEAYRLNVLKGGKTETIQSALAQWETYCQQWEKHMSPTVPLRGLIHIVDNGVYTEHDLVINLPKNSELCIEAANGVRPVLSFAGGLTVNSQHASAQLQLNGLFIDSRLKVNGSLKLDITHCVLVPHGLLIAHGVAHQAPARISLDHSIVGPLRCTNRDSILHIRDSIIDYSSGYALDAAYADSQAGPVVNLERVTVFGKVRVQELEVVRDVIFTDPVLVSKRQTGYIGFCYVPEQSQTPPLDHCQPTRSAPHPGRSDVVVPRFTSTFYGDPGYAQLDPACGPRLLRGASNGAEMGALNSLHSAQRQDNISHMLDEYLPYGFAAGIFYVT
jgi:hypothetical protein